MKKVTLTEKSARLIHEALSTMCILTEGDEREDFVFMRDMFTEQRNVKASLKKPAVYIGFYAYAGYFKLIIEASEEDCWKAMKQKYYADREIWGTPNPRFSTFDTATEYFGWRVEKAQVGSEIIH